MVGTGSWGVTLAIVAARAGASVALLTRTGTEAAALHAARESPRLPGITFPEGLQVTADPAAGLAGVPVVVLAVPAQTMRANVRGLRLHFSPDSVLVTASKGLEIETTQRMSEVIAEEANAAGRIAALSGPNLAREVAAGKPCSTVIACRREAIAQQVQAIFMGRTMRVYTHSDVVGVEMGGALKNIIALGAGMCDGMEAGDNAKAMLMTRGLAEIARLGRAAGAEPLTFAGLAGLGDLIATCMSPLSRNRTVGERLARGELLPDIQATMHQVAEGVPTTVAARRLARQYAVEMPIATLMYHVLFDDMSPLEAGAALMQRDPKPELEGLF